MRSDHAQWAAEEFGTAELGDRRRTERLVRLAAEAAASRGGVIARSCRTPATREGAFRFVENQAFSAERVIAAATRAGARRCESDVAIVPVDASSLLLTDATGKRGMGAVGSLKSGARGIHVMTALLLTAEGAPLGLGSQHYWVRERRSKRPEKGLSKDVENRETRFWLRAMESSRSTLAEQSPHCTPWFQLDRAGDCAPVLEYAHDHDVRLTVRATHDRCVASPHKHLVATVESTKVLRTYRLAVTAKSRVRKRRRKGKQVVHWVTKRQPRIARLTVQAASVRLRVGKRELCFTAVLVREKNRPKDDRIEWLLLTTVNVKGWRDALKIAKAYSLRWRIEDFHRTWKRGLCRIEDTQLRSRQAIIKWATILAAVATRALRLTHLARDQPEVLASTEFTKAELKAIVLLCQPKSITLRHFSTLTLGQVIRWLAVYGGYRPKKDTPPGPGAVAEGLRDMYVGVDLLRNITKKKR